METGTDTTAEPALQHKKRVEGCSSSLTPDFFAPISQIVNEPPLQHKRHFEGHPTSLSTNFFTAPAQKPDFQLLGQQDKFASNVRYNPRLSYSEEKIYKNRENLDRDAPPNKQLKMQKRIKPLIKQRHPPISRSPPRRSKVEQDRSPPRKSNVEQLSLESPPPAPRGHRDNLELMEAMKDKDLKDILSDQPVDKKSQDAALREKRASNEQKVLSYKKDEKAQGTKVADKAGAAGKASKENRNRSEQTEAAGTRKTKETRPQKVPSTMNESVQTNMRKGVAVSTPEAPAEYAMKYKAGMAPPRPIQKVSEYQKQYQWKQGLKESPLLAAEQVVYRSQTDLGPYKTDGVPRVSEYTRNFQVKKPLRVHMDANMNANNSNVARDVAGSKTLKFTGQKRRSKSAGAVHPENDSDESLVEAKARKSDTTEIKEKLAALHRKTRHVATEYRANFKAPERYSYEHGAWKGACPPQLMPTVNSDDDDRNNNANNSAGEKVPLSNWYAEVLELRRRAEEYRRRAEGTHFSRDHLVQLLTKQAECWDLPSEISYTIDALNLESPPVRKKTRLVQAQRDESPSNSGLEDASADRSPSLSEEDAAQTKGNHGRTDVRKSISHLSRKMAWLESQKKSLSEQRKRLQEDLNKSPDEDDSDNEANEGRLPTPLVRKKQEFSPIRRHHLDRTTPAVGGAILTCPPPKDSKIIVTTRSGDSYVTASDELPVKVKAKSYDVNRLVTMPTLGRPSDDTHPLRDDTADSDKLLRTQYIVSPPLPFEDSESGEEDKENGRTQKRAPIKTRSSKPSYLNTVKEGFGETYIRPTKERSTRKANRKADVDLLSESLSSVASSGSLASEVLERSKQRQKFWTKTSGHH